MLRRRISNIACLVVLCGGGVWALTAARSGTTPASLGIAVLVLAFGTWMHSARVMGGGDVKMLACITAWLPLDHLAQFFFWGAVGTFITSVIVRGLSWRSGGDASVPMAVAILFGVIAVFRPLFERALA